MKSRQRLLALAFITILNVSCLIAIVVMKKNVYQMPQVESTEHEILNREHGYLNSNSILIYRQVVAEGDTLRTILTEQGSVLYVPKSWTDQEIDCVVEHTLGAQNWHGSKSKKVVSKSNLNGRIVIGDSLR